MENEYEKHETDLIDLYVKKGYTINFRYSNGKLIATDIGNKYGPEEIHIVAQHRFEGMSDPSDMSILYVLEASRGEKGTFLCGYGPNADLETAEFFKTVPEKNCSQKENVNFGD